MLGGLFFNNDISWKISSDCLQLVFIHFGTESREEQLKIVPLCNDAMNNAVWAPPENIFSSSPATCPNVLGTARKEGVLAVDFAASSSRADQVLAGLWNKEIYLGRLQFLTGLVQGKSWQHWGAVLCPLVWELLLAVCGKQNKFYKSIQFFCKQMYCVYFVKSGYLLGNIFSTAGVSGNDIWEFGNGNRNG